MKVNIKSRSDNTQAPDKYNLDMYVSTLESIQEQIRFADTKAGFVAALNTLPFGFIISSLDKFTSGHGHTTKERLICWILLCFLVPYTITTITSIGLVIYTVISRFGEMAPMCKIFFGHIVTKYGKNHEKYVEELKLMSESEWASELATQIVEVSHIALAKHKMVRRAAFTTLLAFVLWILAMAGVLFVVLLWP